MKTMILLVFLLALVAPPRAMSDDQQGDVDLTNFLKSIDGGTEPNMLSKGKAISRLIKHPSEHTIELAAEDEELLARERARIASFEREIRTFELTAISNLGQTYIQGVPSDRIDVKSVAAELHKIYGGVNKKYDKHFIALLDQLTPQGRDYFVNVAIPGMLSRTKSKYLDYRLLAIRHPEYLQRLFFDGWAEISARGGPFGGTAETEISEELLPSGIVVGRISRTEN